MDFKATYLADFVSLIFPELCCSCGESLVGKEKLVCTGCLYNLPFTNFHLQADNIVARQFWGKVNLEGAYAMCYFTKGGNMQNLMHHFKYKGISEVGNLMGGIAAGQLIHNAAFNTVDYIIPVPLHKKRLRERGYNQSACFAAGLAGKLEVPFSETHLLRLKRTDTQTHKSRFARFENMQEVFYVDKAGDLAGKHILLVDDIVTTGATLTACCEELLKVPGLKISIATIAYAE